MRTSTASRPLLAALLATGLLVGVAACGDDDEPTDTGAGDTTGDDGGTGNDYGGTTGGGTTGGGSTGGEAKAGTIVAKDFALSDITVAPGEEIVLQNDDGTKHTATADDGAFDLEAEGGETSDPGTAPSEPGDYSFHCEIHASMTATLTVES